MELKDGLKLFYFSKFVISIICLITILLNKFTILVYLDIINGASLIFLNNFYIYAFGEVTYIALFISFLLILFEGYVIFKKFEVNKYVVGAFAINVLTILYLYMR